MKRHALFIVLVILLWTTCSVQPGRAQEMPKDYQEVLKHVGWSGDYKAKVLKINIPRTDLNMTVADVPTPTPFGFGGWVAMTKGNGNKDVMMGDVVLRPAEVWPVMSAILNNGLEVTALHNHFFWEEPRIAYMHIHGYGGAMELARKVKPALDLIAQFAATAPKSGLTAAPQGKLDTATIAKIVGHEGEQSGGVYKITEGRDDIGLKEMGATINARMGLNSWAAFVGTDEQAAVAGDVAMRENELTPVLKALLSHNLTVVAVHNHMTGIAQPIVFLHYWGQGPAEQLARGFRSALDEIAKSTGKEKHQQRPSAGAM